MTWNPHSMINDRYTSDDRTRPVQAAHHNVSLAIARAERYFSGLGHAKEADQLRALGSLVQANAVQHCERLLANGHSKSTPPANHSASASTALAPEAPVEHSQAPVDEEGAGMDGCHVAIRETLGIATSDISGDVAADPVSEVKPRVGAIIQDRINELTPLAREEQRYEVSVKYLYRARAMLEGGTDHTGRLLSREARESKAWALIKAAANVLEPMAEVANG